MKHQGIAALLILAIQASTALAQELQVQGRVSHEGTPLAEATVMEMDANHRILNHTRTDGQGRFVMKVTGGKTSLRVTARGMRRFTQKIGRNTRWEVEMKEDNTPQVPNKVRSRHETMKLFVGHMQNRAIAQISWVEHLTDTTFTLVVPVRMPTMVEEYPTGRRMTVTDYNGHIIATGTCIEQAVPEEGLPKSWDPFIRPSTNNAADNASPFTTNERDYFAYPRFSFTKAELEYMIDHASELACFAVDTSRGDNFWMYYPSTKFSKELQKILNKMQK